MREASEEMMSRIRQWCSLYSRAGGIETDWRIPVFVGMAILILWGCIRVGD